MVRFAPLRAIRYERAKRQRKREADLRWQSTQTILSLIGQISITWAGVERILDELIAFYQHVATDLSREHPRSLSSKLKYLRLMQCDPRHNPQIKEFLRSTRIEAKRLGDRRHDLIHGLVSRRNVPGGYWTTQRVVYDGPYARLVITPYTFSDFTNLLAEMTALSHNLSIKVWVITRGRSPGFPASDIEQALRELGLG